MHKTYSMQLRVLATVIFAMFAVAFFIGGISIYEVDKYIQEQAKNFVKVTCENEGSQINDNLLNMEKSVRIMESYLMDFFASAADVENRAVQQEVIKNADQMFVDVAKHTSTSGAVAYYFRLDPTISDGTTGLFYSKLNGSDQFVSLPPTDISVYDKDDTEHVGWFWQPYEMGEALWIKPYHNKNNDILMISYVIPMYAEEKFVGVVGMDFDYKVLSEQVHSIEIYENGFAHLESDGEITCAEEHAAEALDTANSKKYLRVSKGLVNGMTLVVSASYDDIRQIRYDIAFKILLTIAVLSTLFMVIAIIVVKKIVDPLKKLTEASVQLSKGDYDVKITHSSTYEIKLLSTTFENMIRRLREREEHLHLSAHRDSMTGLRNTTSYTKWMEAFDKEIENKKADFGVIVLDLNDLKAANDAYGHDVGNELIVVAAKLISDTFKRSPVFRIGGDEFVVVLQNKDLAEYENLLAQFGAQCENTFVEREQAKIPVRVAVGFARFDADTDLRFVDVFKRADDAMYEDKRKSKAALQS